MLESISPCPQRHKTAVALVTATVCLLAFPKWSASPHPTRSAPAASNHASLASAAPQIVSPGDPAAIRELQHRYASAASARAPQIQFAVAKLLDSSRHREELGDRHLVVLTPPEPAPYEEKLSTLPR